MIIVFRRSAEGGHSASTTGTGDAKGGPFGKFWENRTGIPMDDMEILGKTLGFMTSDGVFFD